MEMERFAPIRLESIYLITFKCSRRIEPTNTAYLEADLGAGKFHMTVYDKDIRNDFSSATHSNDFDWFLLKRSITTIVQKMNYFTEDTQCFPSGTSRFY